MQFYDQYDMCNSAGVEQLIRQVVQYERAVNRNPKQPDFKGLDLIMSSVIDESGAVQVRRFEKWLAEAQKDEAIVLKGGRLWREEVAADAKRLKDKNNDNPTGSGDGSGKKK